MWGLWLDPTWFVLGTDPSPWAQDDKREGLRPRACRDDGDTKMGAPLPTTAGAGSTTVGHDGWGGIATFTFCLRVALEISRVVRRVSAR